MKGFGTNIPAKKNRSFSLKKKLIDEALFFESQGNLNHAAKCYQNIFNRGLGDSKLVSNYGIVLFQLGFIEKSINLFKNSIQTYPKEQELYINLSNIFKLTNDLNNAEFYIRKSLEINPNSSIALNNLSSILILLKRFSEAEKYSLFSVQIEEENHIGQHNLGMIYSNLNSLENAIYRYKKALEYNGQDFASNLNLGEVLLKIGDFKEAKIYSEIALSLNKSSYEALFNLGLIALFTKNYRLALSFFKDSVQHCDFKYEIYKYLGIAQYICSKEKICSKEEAIKSLNKSIRQCGTDKISEIIIRLINSENNLNKREKNYKKNKILSQIINPIVMNKTVSKNLINYIYERNTYDLNKFNDPTFGNARGTDYKFFEGNDEILNSIKFDLIKLIKNHFKSEVYIQESFFTILEGESEVKKHDHLSNLDKLDNLKLSQAKFSLVYYLKTGDQDCSHPGYINFYDPSDKILPKEGMIIIFPSERKHSVIYNGKKDRVIIGVNFYIY